MNQNDNRPDLSIAASDEHQAATTLLDAYATAELTADERALVERHLASCLECQQAFSQLTHLHSLLKLPLKESEAATLKGYGDGMPEYKPGVSNLADSVLDRLAQSDREESAPPISLASGQFSPDHIGAPRHAKKDRRRLPGLLVLVAVAICVAVLAVLCLPVIGQSLSTLTNNNPSGAISMPAPWNFHQDQTAVRHGQEAFALKYTMVVNERNWVLIYAFRASHPGVAPQVKVISSLPEQPGKTTNVPADVRTLGNVGDFTMGVIYVRIPDRVGQSITLQGQFPDQTSPWRLTLMDQVSALPALSNQSNGRSWYSVGQESLPEIRQIYPNSLSSPKDANAPAGDQLLDLFGFTLSARPQAGTAVTPLYMRVDYAGKPASLRVTAISYAEYKRLAGPQLTPTPRATAAPGSTVHLSTDKASYGRTDTIRVTITSDFPYTVSFGVPRTSCTPMVQLEMQVNGVWTPVGHCDVPFPMMGLDAHKASYYSFQPQYAFGWKQSATSWQPGLYRITTSYSTNPNAQNGVGQKVISPTFTITP